MVEYKVKVYKDRTEWYLNDKLHRENGLPAIEYADAYKAWCINGKRHREDGAAIEWSNGDKSWFLNGISYSEEEFKRKTQKVKELTVKEITELLGYNIKIIK